MSNELKYKSMTEQLRMTNSDEDVANYIRWIIKSDSAKEYWQSERQKWIKPSDEKPDADRKIIFKLKNNDKRMGVFLAKDQFDRENMFCDGSFHKLETVIGWMYVTD